MFKTRAALLTKLATLTGSTPIAYPNKPFTPTPGVLWLKADFVPADNSPATLGTTGDDEITGFFQVGIYAPANSGDVTSVNWLDTLQAGFKNGSVISYQGRNVRITHSQHNAGNEVTIDTSVWYPTYLTVYFSARKQRT